MADAWWLKHIFGQSLAAKTNPKDAKVAAEIPPRDALGIMTRLFSSCGSLFPPFTDRQVGEGLVFLSSAGESGWMYYIYDPSVDWKIRADCIRSIEALYRDCFSRRCLSTALKRSSDLNALDSVCFMWWDRFPSGGLSTTKEETVYLELLEVMAKTLQIENTACQESALHGLGHFGGYDMKRARVAIDDWLASHPHSALRPYAEAARKENVQ